MNTLNALPLEGTWNPFACWLNSYRRALRAPGTGRSKAWRSRSLGKGNAAAWVLQGHLWDTTFRGRGSAFAQPRFEVSQSAEGVVGAPCCRDGDAAAPVSPAARSSFGLKPCLWGWALCRERGCSHARAKWVTATPGWQPAAPGEAAQDGLRGREGAKQPLGIQRGGSERR